LNSRLFRVFNFIYSRTDCERLFSGMRPSRNRRRAETTSTTRRQTSGVDCRTLARFSVPIRPARWAFSEWRMIHSVTVHARRLCTSIPRSACLRPHLSEMTDRINKRLECVKQSVRGGELPRNSDNLQCFHSRSLGASNSLTASCVRRSSLEETEMIYRKSARGRQALLGRCANFICG
jgi:hypothetical protein